MAENEGASSAATLEGILGEGQPLGAPAEDTTQGAGAGTEQVEGTEQEVVEQVEGEQAPVEGEVAEGEQGEEEAAPEETDISPEESEVDYADAVYERYAQHIQKTKNLQQPLNIQDPATRAMLYEIIQRGENFRRLQAERQQVEETAEPEAETEEGAAEEAPLQATPEQTQQFLQQIDKFAGSVVRPEVAKVFTEDYFTAMWGDKGKAAAAKTTPEQQAGLLKVFTKMGYLLLNDALPQILPGYIPGLLSQQFPGFDTSMQDAVNEAAYELVANATDRAGNPLYPDIEELVFGDGGELEAVYQQHPWLSDRKFADKQGRLLPPVEQAQRRLELAVSLARGQTPAPELMRGAAEAGRQQARRAQTVSNSGRLAPGESGGTFERGGNEAEDLLKGMQQFGDRDRAVQDMLAPKQR